MFSIVILSNKLDLNQETRFTILQILQILDQAEKTYEEQSPQLLPPSVTKSKKSITRIPGSRGSRKHGINLIYLISLLLTLQHNKLERFSQSTVLG